MNMNYVTSFAEGDREIYVGTTGGVRRFNLFTGKEGRPLTTAEGLRDNNVRRIAYDHRIGDLYIDTPAGIDRLGIESEIIFPSAQFPEEAVDPTDDLPKSFKLDSLILEPGLIVEGDKIRDRESRTYRITGHHKDRWNRLWVGTWGLGVGFADIQHRNLNLKLYGPVNNNVTAFMADGDDIWIGGLEGGLSSFEVQRTRSFGPVAIPGGGITRFNTRTGTWRTHEPRVVFGLDGANVLSILLDESDIWFATSNGLVRFEKEKDVWRTYWRFGGVPERAVTDALRDGKWLWVGTPTGLALLDVDGDSTLAISGGKQTFIYDMEEGEGYLWAATSRGVFRCEVGDRKWKRFRDKDGNLSNRITAVTSYEDNVWFAVLSPPGLVRLNATDQVTTRFPLPELADRPIAGIAIDDNHVWIATEIGAMRLTPETGVWRRFTKADGLVDEQVQAVMRDERGVWFGTVRGVSHLKREWD